MAHAILLVSLIANLLFHTLADYPCAAYPFEIGPACVAPYPVTGFTGTSILYRITTILADTKIACYATATAYPEPCNDKEWDWKYLGWINADSILELYWGNFKGYPMIKCGSLFYTPFKWDWLVRSTNNTDCMYNERCCGDYCYNLENQICCTDDQENYICPAHTECCNGLCANDGTPCA